MFHFSPCFLFPPTAALKLIQRSGHGFNALCTAATEGFRKFDVDHSDWMELDKLPSLLQQLQHVPMAPPLMDQSVHGKGEEGEEGDEGDEGGEGDEGAEEIGPDGVLDGVQNLADLFKKIAKEH